MLGVPSLICSSLQSLTSIRRQWARLAKRLSMACWSGAKQHCQAVFLRGAKLIQVAASAGSVSEASADELWNSLPALLNQSLHWMIVGQPGGQCNKLPGWFGWLAGVMGWLIVSALGSLGRSMLTVSDSGEVWCNRLGGPT